MRSLIIALFLFSASANAQINQPDKFWGVPWGASVDSAKAIVKRNTGYKLVEIADTDKKRGLQCVDCDFAGHKSNILLAFSKNGLYMGHVQIPVENRRKVVSVYDDIKAAITEKWGKPVDDIESYPSPYEKGCGIEYVPIALGKAFVYAKWKFINSSEILINISEDLSIKIYYADGAEFSESLQAKKVKEQADY